MSCEDLLANVLKRVFFFFKFLEIVFNSVKWDKIANVIVFFIILPQSL